MPRLDENDDRINLDLLQHMKVQNAPTQNLLVPHPR